MHFTEVQTVRTWVDLEGLFLEAIELLIHNSILSGLHYNSDNPALKDFLRIQKADYARLNTHP